MTPEYDPNQKLEENLKKDGEFLRDVDKGHTPTETGLDLDLGIVRDEHADVMEELGTVADAEGPSPPAVESVADAPVSQPALQAEHNQTIEQMERVAPKPKPVPPTPGRFGTEQLQTEHAQTFVEMGRVVLESRPQPEKPTPITSTVPEMERLSFPREQNQTQVRGAMEGVIREQMEWNVTLTDLLKAVAENQRQFRLELDRILGFLERLRL